MSEWINPGLLWFLIGLACIVAELMLPGFVVIFFGFGAWVTALLLWLGWITSFDVQLITFITATILSLILFRKQGKRYFEGKTSGKMGPGRISRISRESAQSPRPTLSPATSTARWNSAAHYGRRSRTSKSHAVLWSRSSVARTCSSS